ASQPDRRRPRAGQAARRGQAGSRLRPRRACVDGQLRVSETRGGAAAQGLERANGRHAVASVRAPRPLSTQLTADRENARIEIAVSAAAYTATTARLSQASTVTLCMPQMSCRPLPLGSMNP